MSSCAPTLEKILSTIPIFAKVAGTNDPISVRTVLENVYKLVGNENDFEEVLSLMKEKKTIGEIQCQYMNYDKVNEYFNWSPSHSLKDGLAKSIEWYDKWNQRK